MTQRLINENRKLPILQILVYPWLQLVNFSSPSYIRNRKTSCYAITSIKCILWYLGIGKITGEMEEAIAQSQHLLLIEDVNQRLKYLDCLSIDHIPDVYKKDGMYNDYAGLSTLAHLKLDERNILKRDKKFAKAALRLFDTEISPGLIDDEMLKKFPQTYFIICACDEFKDENLVFAERLRKKNVEVNIAFSEDGYHGMITDISDDYLNRNSVKLVDDLVDFIKIKV
jgi:acetyl esterase/lipase